ncbi:hypothetical protein FRX31_017088, partial [Thalictrum thalictroides]
MLAVNESSVFIVHTSLAMADHLFKEANKMELMFRSRFRLNHPEAEYSEPGIFALQAYDAAWAVAEAMKMGGSSDPGR